MSNFITDYLRYTEHTEPPYIYHRWCALAAVSAILGRSYYIPFGHARIFPNLYCLLIGEPGTRKSTAIKTICRKLVSASGYDTFAADKTSKEKFLLDLEGVEEDSLLADSLPRGRGRNKWIDPSTMENLWGDDAASLSDPKEVLICADEFSEFSGIGNGEFYTTLGNLWDWDDDSRPFTQRLKNSRSVSIFQPTVTLLAGTTSNKFAKIFPVDIMDDGFLSRMILVRGEKSDRKYDEPPVPDPEHTAELVGILRAIRASNGTRGPAERTAGARAVLKDIYHNWEDIDDIRFKSYSTRRYTQLLKLSLVVSACQYSNTITEEIVIEANTYLSAAENLMPKALGEFGKSKHSDIVDKILQVIENSNKPLTIRDIWKQVDKDLERIDMLMPLINGLDLAGKIQKTKIGILPLKQLSKEQKWVDWSLLTEEEQKGLV